MFTGIIEELGIIEKFEKSREPALLAIKARKTVEGLKKGDSVAVNGTCLTVIAIDKDLFSVEAIGETLKKTTLSELKKGDKVNLEGALISGGKISGHFVTGHVDGIGTIKAKREEKGEILIEIRAERDIMDGVVMKGSVAVDGVSLTVAGVKPGSFSVYIIPHTAAVTTLGMKDSGDRVNIETDMLGKYAAKYSSPGKASKITPEFLKEKGFI